jgi:hypothetical protein
VLTALGGAFEFVGLGLVVREIADDRRQAKQLFVARRPRSKPRRRYPARALAKSGRLMPGAPVALSPAEQQRALVQAFNKLDAAAYNALLEMRKALDAELDGSVDELRSEILSSDNELRGHLRYVLAGSIRTRVTGAVLLGAGIVLEIAGAIVAVVN